jgi:phenylacetate-CoA ligase
MPSINDRIYAQSPVWLQNFGVTLYGLSWWWKRYGGRFPLAVKEFAARDRYSADEWRSYQTRVMREVLVQANRNVPSDQQVFGEIGITEKDLACFDLDDLDKLPLLSKETMRQQPERFIAGNVKQKRLQTYLTSGTTGTPLAIKYSAEMHQVWTAIYEVRCRQWAGVNYKMSRAMIGGRLVVPEAESKPPFWRVNLAERQLYMSAFHISAANTPAYVEELNRFRPDYLVGYASGHFFLARFIVEMGLKVHRPRAVLTSGEKLTDEMRGIIERAYGCDVFDAYNGVEACCLASECEHHQLHISPDLGVVELLTEDGNPARAGELGEIVATGLINFVQPLIRYRTGDWAVLSDQPCPCGREMPVLKDLIGRIEDMVITRDGREMVRFHGIFVGLPHVHQGQVIQESFTQFRVRLVVDQNFGEEERSIIRKRFSERLGQIDLSFEYVDEIELTKRGKFRAVVSKVRRQPVCPNGLESS